MRCTCWASMGAFENIASDAIRKLLSALSGGTHRSSPKKNWIFFHGTLACNSGLVASSPYKTFGVDPPARATEKVPLSRTAFCAASRNSAAAVSAMELASGKILTSRLIFMVSTHSGGRPPYRRRNRTRFGRRLFFSDRPPRVAVARQQFVRFRRPPATRRVVRKVSSRNGSPRIQHRLNHPPTRLHHIRALEQSSVADHAVVQQPLVAGVVVTPKIARVVKVHVHQPEMHDRAWNLRSESQRDSFVGLNVNHQPVRLQIGNLRLAEQHEGRSPKLDGDFRGASRQMFSRAQVKRN